jgi:heme oxygenase
MPYRRATTADAESGGASSRENRPASLSAALKRATSEAHRRAEASGVIRQLIMRKASRGAYICHLRNLLPVYSALELRLTAMTDHPAFGVIAHPLLYRRISIENDLAALVGNDWASAAPLLPASRAYAERIATTDAAGLAAHAYVRYLGDLNGGSILKRLLRESMQLGDAELSYYDFDGIGDTAEYCAAFKRALDALAPDYDAARIVDEALAGFQLATELSIEIEAHLSDAA